jgi:hypothetical protein
MPHLVFRAAANSNAASSCSAACAAAVAAAAVRCFGFHCRLLWLHLSFLRGYCNPAWFTTHSRQMWRSAQNTLRHGLPAFCALKHWTLLLPVHLSCW